MAATPLNIEDFEPEDHLVVDQMLEPIIMDGAKFSTNRNSYFKENRIVINYVGIDLGTTNSAICTYDSSQTRIWKSPEQNDVTPSAIYIDRRGNKYIGKRAYDAAPRSPNNCATLFKRFMGTSTPIELSAIDKTFTPEECSADVLKTLSRLPP